MRHSYTKISMYMQCPMKMKGRYQLGIKEERGPAAQRGVDIHGGFEVAIKDGTALPAEFNFYQDYVDTLRAAGAQSELRVAVDKSWKPCDYGDSGAWIIGILDLWVVRGKTGIGLDWKTGKIYDDHVKQKEFYTCLIADAYPDVEEFVFSNVYVDLQKEVTHKFTRTDVDNLRERWGKRIALMERDTDCAPTPSFMCRYCPVSKARGGPCPF